ncbi:Rrf2 family transcriptional regulator [Roseateles sp.]|uniref:RrF2 family transcriptional regulator n=1 Tax=Roseateles sp. TaxID=1971397 RepID=UPI0025F7F7B2|nr:Rrf2 family transcriptional regulator [Roseateles sp.]MBV8037020.1 Rrf2 family transcriptional regulator [Roseateles sp.]
MKRDGRLSGVLHLLLHMAETGAPATSETLARAMNTNPVVVRRLMAGLRRAGFVASAKGHGGGWVLGCPLSAMTLGDVHAALGAPPFLAAGLRDERSSCLVEQAVNSALGAAYAEAEALLVARLHGVKLSVLAEDFHRRMQERGLSTQDLNHDV